VGHRLTASEETALLRATIRQAHEATQELQAAIKEARLLAPRLVADFEALHLREMTQLANHFQSEMNRQAANLNESVDTARAAILQQLTASEMVLDNTSGMVRLLFPTGKFDDRIPLPHPQVTPEENTP
jgi:hypothetical protein